MKNEVMLITYADSLGSNLRELKTVLDRYFAGAVGGVHILPFYPSSGDRGFSPLCYDQVDAKFGSFADVEGIAAEYDLMVDFMINHISRRSPFMQNYIARKDASPYRDLFIRYRDFWPGGRPSEAELDAIYKRKDKEPSTGITFADGSSETLWCTFSDEQVDLDVSTRVTKNFMKESMDTLCGKGAALVRLDAFAYAVKKAGTSCFFVEPEIWDLLEELKGYTAAHGVEILPEVHEHYTLQLKLAQRGYWIYDFALPMLVLHALYSGNGTYLKDWLLKSPMKQFTTLDTHDGIGVVDVKDLLPDAEIEFTKGKMYAEGANVKKKYSTAAYNNLDIYQINTSYYSALGNNDKAYLLARAIQFFAPGIPQVYYVGALAGKNDIELMEATKNGRDINRHNYSVQEVEAEIGRPVVKKLHDLMRFRNSHPAFALDSSIEVALEGSRLEITRSSQGAYAKLDANLLTHEFTLETSQAQGAPDMVRYA